MLYRSLLIWLMLPLAMPAQTGTIPGKAQQAAAYTEAIRVYIKAIYKSEKLLPDTLFIGKHEEFPDIALPASIMGTGIVLLSTEEANKRLSYHPSMRYINMVCSCTSDYANFLLVTFLLSAHDKSPVYIPQHNCHIDLRYMPISKGYEMEKIDFKPYPIRD